MEDVMESIRRDEVISLAEFKRRTGFSRWSVVGLRESGFPLKRIGQQTFVRGEDWFTFLDRVPNDHKIACNKVPERKAV